MTATPIRLALRRSLHDIHHLSAVAPKHATGQVATVYRQLEREFGLLAPPIALHSPAPAVLAAAWVMLRESLVAQGVATRAAKEVVATSVSRANTCPYCVEVHGMTLGSLGHGDLAATLTEGTEITDPDSAALAAWARGEQSEPPPGRTTEELAELVGVAVAFHYLNRMVNIFLGSSPLPASVPDSARPTVRRVLGRFLRPSGRVEPGESLSLLPEASVPVDLAWARGNPVVCTAFARAAGTIDAVSAVPASVRHLVLSELVGWDGAPLGLSTAWVVPLLDDLPLAERPTARLALLTAFASTQVDSSVIAEFREHNGSAKDLVEVVSWAGLAAARALGARIPVSAPAGTC